MQKKRRNKYHLFLHKLKKFDRWGNVLLALFSLPFIYLLVYYTGGTQYVYSHTMYIPIIFSGIALGGKWGLIVGVLGGLTLGPYMPQNVYLSIDQEFDNWFFRLLMFATTGILSGYATDTLRRNLKIVSHFNQETSIPNVNSLSEMKSKITDYRKHTIMSVLVNNYDEIVDLLGKESYYNVLKLIYGNLRSCLPKNTIIVQSDSNCFWIAKVSVNNLGDDIQRVLNNLNQTIVMDGIPLYVEFSLGVDTVPYGELCMYDTTYRRSDISARFAQKNNIPFAIFNEMYSKKSSNYELLGTFLQALKEDQTFLVYQPKVDLRTNQTIGLEALVRWEHPIHGIIMPDEFIPMVEETQLIHSLTDWVLKKAIQKLKEFKQENIDICVSINISAKNLFDTNFLERVMNIINSEKISPRQIEFEIVESALIVNPEESKVLLKQLHDLEFSISLDDFGKGYSSLSYLSQLPIQIVKIDKYFSSRVVEDLGVRYTVEAIINLAHQLGYETVAEGIEDDVSAKLLQELGCYYAQGYYFAKPIRDNQIIDWYKKNNDFLK